MREVHVAGHFGEWIQGRMGRTGPVVLISLPCAAVGVTGRACTARGVRLSGAGVGVVTARRFLARLGLGLPGRVSLHASVAPGLGAGVSTARLVALARLAGWHGDPLDLARACIACEGASDPLMFSVPEQLLWASRCGEVLAHLPAPPRYEVLGGFWGGPRRTDSRDSGFADISDLVSAWEQGGGLADLTELASESGARCLRMRGPCDDPTPRLARDLGAMGWTMAHTGAARALIFVPGQVPDDAGPTLRAAGWRGLRRFRGGES